VFSRNSNQPGATHVMRFSFCVDTSPSRRAFTRLLIWPSAVISAVVLLAACGCQQRDATVQDPEFDEDQWIYEPPANLYPTDSRRVPDARQPEGRVGLDQIELVDLNLVLRKVAFDRPVNGRTSLFVAATETSNAMFAAYLVETSQMRDDTRLQDFVRRLDKSGVSSTGAPLVWIRNPDALWRKGIFPEGLDNHPVSFITVGDAIAFCEWLNRRYDIAGEFRLPTDREWLAAAYGLDRNYPWGNDPLDFASATTATVDSELALATPDGLLWMWGNVSELVLTDSNGYGGKIEDFRDPIITQWLGPHFADRDGSPRQDYWGYTHSKSSRADTWGFRVVFVPANVEL